MARFPFDFVLLFVLDVVGPLRLYFILAGRTHSFGQLDDIGFALLGHPNLGVRLFRQSDGSFCFFFILALLPHLLVSYLLEFGLLLCFFPLLQKLKCRNPSTLQINMQKDQLHQQKSQHTQNSHNHPHRNRPFQVVPHIGLLNGRHVSPSHQIDHNMRKSADNQVKEHPIIVIPHTIVYPHTVMVKLSHASVTYFTVFAVVGAKRITELAVVWLLVVYIEIDTSVHFWPFVAIDEWIGRVWAGGHDCADEHDDSCADVQSE